MAPLFVVVAVGRRPTVEGEEDAHARRDVVARVVRSLERHTEQPPVHVAELGRLVRPASARERDGADAVESAQGAVQAEKPVFRLDDRPVETEVVRHDPLRLVGLDVERQLSEGGVERDALAPRSVGRDAVDRTDLVGDQEAVRLDDHGLQRAVLRRRVGDDPGDRDDARLDAAARQAGRFGVDEQVHGRDRSGSRLEKPRPVLLGHDRDRLAGVAQFAGPDDLGAEG